MTAIIGIDPGPEESAMVRLVDGRPILARILPNPNLRAVLHVHFPRHQVAIERIASMGMAVGDEVFQTCFETGRMIETVGDEFVTLIKRHEVKTHLCANSRAKDANIRQALLDRFGPGRERAIGTKAKPGPLYGIASDMWSALAIAVTWHDRQTIPQRSATS